MSTTANWRYMTEIARLVYMHKLQGGGEITISCLNELNFSFLVTVSVSQSYTVRQNIKLMTHACPKIMTAQKL